MSKVLDFTPLSHLKAIEQLDAFIEWAKTTLPKGIINQRAHAGIRWDMCSWHNSGITGCSFSAQISPINKKSKNKKYMQPSFMDFAKALTVYHRIYRGKKTVGDILNATRILEYALVEVTGKSDVTQVSSAICNRACEHLESMYPAGNQAYNRGKQLETIIAFMRDKELLETPFRWTSPLPHKVFGTLKDQQINSEKKLPSRASIHALGELFSNNLSSPLDIITVSACALLLSQPSRIGELADIEHDCITFKDDANGKSRMFLRWHANKGFGATIKPVITGMEPAVVRVISLVTPLTAEARSYAAWLEDHPNEFPPHEKVPLKDLDDPLSYEEACSALRLKNDINHTARIIFKKKFVDALHRRAALSPQAQSVINEIYHGWDNSKGKRIYMNGKLNHHQFSDRACITLRKLNILVREKYLSKDFPYTTPPEENKKRIKYRDALFTVKTGELYKDTNGTNTIQKDFGVTIAVTPTRMSAQLNGDVCNAHRSIFQRHGYGNIRVNTHAFRHELNTEMHRAGLSQLLIDAFSGRTTRGSVYNHVTIKERTQAVASFHPKTKQSNAAKCLDKVITNTPLRLSDLIDLCDSHQDRVIHKTHLGICVHSFESEPCPKMGACLACGNLGCVKGDNVKLSNLKEERIYLKQRYEKAMTAEENEIFGASEWCKKAGLDLLKCDALIKLLESPDIKDGDIVWNQDNGWNLTRNAAEMAGFIDAKLIGAPKKPHLSSLEELSALLDKIEV